MPTYAKDTMVPSDRSRAEIERTLQRYGADSFAYAWQRNTAVIGFEINGRRYKIVLPLPEQSEFSHTPARGTVRSREAQLSAWEQATRQRWRALALYVKAVLEAAEAGIINIEEALQPYTLLPNGETVGEWIGPQIESVYVTGRMPAMLLGLTAGDPFKE